MLPYLFFFFNDTATTEIYTLSLHDALPISTFLFTPITAKAANGDFSFPLQLGAGVPNPINYADAASTNLFYWINRAHDLHYLSGFDEAAGNFQQDNFGRGGAGGDPMYAYTH